MLVNTSIKEGENNAKNEFIEKSVKLFCLLIGDLQSQRVQEVEFELYGDLSFYSLRQALKSNGQKFCHLELKKANE